MICRPAIGQRTRAILRPQKSTAIFRRETIFQRGPVPNAGGTGSLAFSIDSLATALRYSSGRERTGFTAIVTVKRKERGDIPAAGWHNKRLLPGVRGVRKIDMSEKFEGVL